METSLFRQPLSCTNSDNGNHQWRTHRHRSAPHHSLVPTPCHHWLTARRLAVGHLLHGRHTPITILSNAATTPIKCKNNDFHPLPHFVYPGETIRLSWPEWLIKYRQCAHTGLYARTDTCFLQSNTMWRPDRKKLVIPQHITSEAGVERVNTTGVSRVVHQLFPLLSKRTMDVQRCLEHRSTTLSI